MVKKRTSRLSGEGVHPSLSLNLPNEISSSNNEAVALSKSKTRSIETQFALQTPLVGIRLHNKNEESKLEVGRSNAEVLNLGEIYLNDLSDIRTFDLVNLKNRHVKVQLKAELRKPFHLSTWGFQVENENIDSLEPKKKTFPEEDFAHLPISVVRSSSKAALCSENAYLGEGYNELFNHIGLINEVVLDAKESKRIIFSMSAKLDHQRASNMHNSYNTSNADSSEEERMHLNETSCLLLTGRISIITQYANIKSGDVKEIPSEINLPIQGQSCRSLLRLDVKELHFDDCVPGGSYVKDFTVWNRSEIPLLFNLVSSVSGFDQANQLITCTDYNSGFVIGDKTCQAAAYGHVRIRVTFRPIEVGEQCFELHVQNLHDCRNVKILKIHAIANKEHHREGLSIREPSGSYLMSGSKLDFGDCYTGVATCKTLTIKNTTEAPLHVELTSDRPKEITFELKLQQNRARTSRAPRTDDVLSPTDSNDGSRSSHKGSMSPESSRVAPTVNFPPSDPPFGMDSDEEADENEVELYEEEFPKRLSYEENNLGDIDDADDDFEFDGERKPQRSPVLSPKTMRIGSANTATGAASVGGGLTFDGRKRSFRTKSKKSSGKAIPRVRDLTYESGVESSASICSSPERKSRSESRRQFSLAGDDFALSTGAGGSNFLVETIDLASGLERTILIWYCPTAGSVPDSLFGENNSDAVDLKGCRLTKQTFRVSFRCYQVQGAWQQAQTRVYDRTLGKSIHVRARTCTSVVTVTPSILHLGDCNIGELKGSSCMLTNHSELPTIVKPLVTSKVISTVPNDEMTLGPKQSTELKIEIIPRKINPNYSRLISIVNLRNKSNIPQICVRSSNMDAHHVIYHSLFYRLLTPTKSAFLNFDHVVVNSLGFQVFDLENITNAPLHLNLQSSDPTKVKLYLFRMNIINGTSEERNQRSLLIKKFEDTKSGDSGEGTKQQLFHASSSSVSVSGGSGVSGNKSITSQIGHRQSGRVIRRRRSIGSIAELGSGAANSGSKRSISNVLRGYLNKKMSSNVGQIGIQGSAVGSTTDVSKARNLTESLGSASSAFALSPTSSSIASPSGSNSSLSGVGSSIGPTGSDFGVGSTPGSPTSTSMTTGPQKTEELSSLIDLNERSRAECDHYCHGVAISHEKEQEIVNMVRERMRRFQALALEKKMVPLHSSKNHNLRIPAKTKQRIVAVFGPTIESNIGDDGAKVRLEKYKIFITLPPGGNKKAVADASARISPLVGSQNGWSLTSGGGMKHPFDNRPSVRELLLKSRVCRSVMNVNQKNINFGRITTSSKSSKKLVVQNMSAIPLVYSVEKTGSISSGFLEIKEGEMGVIKAFGSKHICFEFQPTLAGPFEEKLKIVNVQDVENSVYVTIKAKVVKRETFKLLQSGQVLSLGKCLVGEKSDEIKVVVRNTSRKRREYVIQVDPSFTQPNLRPTFYFSLDDTPAATITQAQEKKLDEELEKLEHKLRIAVTKKKTEKISKLNSKIMRVKALLSGEQLPEEKKKTPVDSLESESGKNITGIDSGSTTGGRPESGLDSYDSANSESECSESEYSSRGTKRRGSRANGASSNASTTGVVASNTNIFHFSLEPEATCRVLAHAIFHTINPSTPGSSPTKTSGVFKSQKARKRQLKKDSTPVSGVGKFLLYEQQNKDVMKELQYSTEVFYRTPAGENAYCRAVGKSLLPPFPHATPPKGALLRKLSSSKLPLDKEATTDNSNNSTKKLEKGSELVMLSTPTTVVPAVSVPSQNVSDSTISVDRRNNLSILIPDTSTNSDSRLLMELVPNQGGASAYARSSTLFIPVEEAPLDCSGWTVQLSHGSERELTVDITWEAFDYVRHLLSFSCDVKSLECLLSNDGAAKSSLDFKESAQDQCCPLVPINLIIPPKSNCILQFKWCFSSGAGYAASTPMAAGMSGSALESVGKKEGLLAGKIHFTSRIAPSSGYLSQAQFFVGANTSLDVALVKALQRSLSVEVERIDLGEHLQNTEISGEFNLWNHSSQTVKYLLLGASMKSSHDSNNINPSSSNTPASPTSSNNPNSSTSSSVVSAAGSTSSSGEICFESSTGTIEQNSSVIVRFTYKGIIPGQHIDHILVKNLNDRLDSTAVSLLVRVTRPVYVRIPELDPHATGKLEVLEVGPCYVTPEMQDTTLDSPNIALKFSKVHKLTLQSQVEEMLVLSASSNLKTQCYVYEDSRLLHEASNVLLRGNSVVDLYIAFRPKLPSDAFKTAAARDLVGGIRVQLFRALSSGAVTNDLTNAPLSGALHDDEKSEMVAEFTVKFVGIAGASLARVSHSLIDFGVEVSAGRTQRRQNHNGHFELLNVSKALPLCYRLHVTRDVDGYSDDDESLHVTLKSENGEIAPGETGQIGFRLAAYKTSGLFRRRIVIENVNYPGKLLYVDVVLFVDSGSIRCEAFPCSPLQSPSVSSSPKKSMNLATVDFGVVNVIKMDEKVLTELSFIAATTSVVPPTDYEGANTSTGRRYRIFEEHSDGPYFNTRRVQRSSTQDRYLVLTNKTSTKMLLRPLSTVPLTFYWVSNTPSTVVSPSSVEMKKQMKPIASMITSHDARKLDIGESSLGSGVNHIGGNAFIYYGESCYIEPKGSCTLFYRFAPIAMTNPLPCDVIDSGRLQAFKGIIAIQNFGKAGAKGSDPEASTLKVVNLSGFYGEPRISISEKRISLGKIGYAIGWKTCKFEIVIKNVSEAPVSFAISTLPNCICVRDVRGANSVNFGDGATNNGQIPPREAVEEEFPSLRTLALQADRHMKKDATPGWNVWRLEPQNSCTLEMEFLHTSDFISAGNHAFDLRFLNLYNPHNVEHISVHAQVISSYAELIVNPESSDVGINDTTLVNNLIESENKSVNSHTVAYFPPVTVPPPLDALPHACSFWFSLRNIYDEELCVKLSSKLKSNFQSMMELLLFSRSSNTPISTVQVSPGESIDIRVVCRVFSSARLSAAQLASATNSFDVQELGTVLLEIGIANMKETSQNQEIMIKGRLVPGRTFTLSTSTLHFYAVASELPGDLQTEYLPASLKNKTGSRDSTVYQLRNMSESLWLRNPCTTQPLNFIIEPISMYHPGLCLIKGGSTSEMCAMSEFVQAIAVPSSGTVPPGEAIKIIVRLEEASLAPFMDNSGNMEHDEDLAAKSLLHKLRHHPSWRSTSWGVENDEAIDPNALNHMYLTIRDADMNSDFGGVTADVDIHLILQNQNTPLLPNESKQTATIDKALLGAAFAAREKRLLTPKKNYPPQTLPDLNWQNLSRDLSNFATLDNFEEFDVGSIRSGTALRKKQLPVLAIRGCTPVENSSLDSTRYVIDVGQHTIRNGGEIEWEITIESMFNSVNSQNDSTSMDPIDYRIYLVDKNAVSWLQLSRERGTLDRTRSFQSVVLYFLRDVVGIFSTFVVLENLTNPSDVKVIHVRLEVIADLNSLRSMSSSLDPTSHLFCVLASSHYNLKKPQKLSNENTNTGGNVDGIGKLEIDYGDVYYHKVYHNHSIVLENSSSLNLDFMLSSNARPQEVNFSVSPNSLNEVSTVTLAAHARTQVFIHFRPLPKTSSSSTSVLGSNPNTSATIQTVSSPSSSSTASDHWKRDIEIYVNCRLVKDFRETVVLKAICNYPQLGVNVSSSKPDESIIKAVEGAGSSPFSTQPSFLGVVFSMPESSLGLAEAAISSSSEAERFIIVKNTRTDSTARMALRNDSMFFNVTVGTNVSDKGNEEVDYLDNGVCGGRRPTVLVTIKPNSFIVFRVTPDLGALKKHHQMWDHSVKEHITIYNIKQFAEHYQVTICFTCSNIASFYIPPSITEGYPFSALEDTIAKFLQNYNYTWKWLINYHDKAPENTLSNRLPQQSMIPAAQLAEMLGDLESALEYSSPLSPIKPNAASAVETFGTTQRLEGFSCVQSKETLHQLLQSYRALYFDFYYITDELVWYGVRGSAVRHSLTLADLAYGVVFGNDIFRAFMTSPPESLANVVFPRLLLPWIRQLGHFLSFFPENQEATLPLRQLYDKLRQFEQV